MTDSEAVARLQAEIVASKMNVSKTEAAPQPWRRVKRVSAAIAEASSADQSGSKGDAPGKRCNKGFDAMESKR